MSYDITYMWNLKYMTQMNLPMKQKQIHRYREHTGGCQSGRDEAGMNWEFGTSKCKHIIYRMDKQGPTV